MREEQADHQIEREGKELRSMMDWIDQDVLAARAVHSLDRRDWRLEVESTTGERREHPPYAWAQHR